MQKHTQYLCYNEAIRMEEIMKLFQEFTHPKISFKNHLVMAPMCMYSVDTHDGMVKPFHIAHYSTRALGQVGYIIVESTGVNPEGRITDACLGLYNDEQRDAFIPLVKSVQDLGSKIGIQLNHAGRKSTATTDVVNCVAPSAIAFSDEYRTPTELSIEDIKNVFQDFKNAAKRADEGGFDAIELHAAHGYLISQFMSPMTNKRTDEYKNPSFFLNELVDTVLESWPKEKLFTMRISYTDYEEDGYDVDDCIEMLRPVADKIDIIHVSSGGITDIRPPRIFPGYQVEAATKIKKELNRPVITCGLINELDLVSDILENDRADLVAMGRNLLKDPHWLLVQAQKRRKTDVIPVQYIRGFK